MTDVAHLLEGYRRFHTRHYKDANALLPHLASHGQQAKTLVIACSDSRVDPAIIMDADPGDIFVVRNVANLVPPYEENGEYHGTSAALEFAVRHLHVQHIVVFGHSGCAGIGALLHTTPEEENFRFINPWVNIAARAKDYTHHLCGSLDHPDANTICEQQGILISLQNLRTFPWIADLMDSGKLTLHGWYFKMHNGQLLVWDDFDSRFVTV